MKQARVYSQLDRQQLETVLAKIRGKPRVSAGDVLALLQSVGTSVRWMLGRLSDVRC